MRVFPPHRLRLLLKLDDGARREVPLPKRAPPLFSLVVSPYNSMGKLSFTVDKMMAVDVLDTPTAALMRASICSREAVDAVII